MNTIPSIFDGSMPSYTAVGGTERKASTGITAVLLNRAGRFPRRTLFQDLEKVGFDYIISMEGAQGRYDLEELSTRFPSVRFILQKEDLSPGEQINLAVSEITSPFFFVLWNDLKLLHAGGAVRMAERLFYPKPGRGGEIRYPNRRLCTVPVIQNTLFDPLPTLIAPVFERGMIKTMFFASQREGLPSLYPFDGVGIYDRDRFVLLGGFDAALKSPHWQFMDFGFRAHLWGEEIRLTQMVRLSYNGDIPQEDSTAEESYRRFYLKNIAPVYRGGMVHLPWVRFPGYFFRSGRDLFQAVSDFAEGRRWVKENGGRFTRDARSVTETWEPPVEDRTALPPDSHDDGGDRRGKITPFPDAGKFEFSSLLSFFKDFPGSASAAQTAAAAVPGR